MWSIKKTEFEGWIKVLVNNSEEIIELLRTADNNAFDAIIGAAVEYEWIKLDNFVKNMRGLHRSLVTDRFFGENNPYSIAVYIMQTNTLVVDKHNFSNLIYHNFTLILHEYVHILSSNLEKFITGYQIDEEHKMFNEAATQWLVCKILGIDVNDNPIYTEPTKMFDDLVRVFGEEKMYSGFFDADYSKFLSQFTDIEKAVIEQKVTEMNKTLEAQQLKETFTYLDKRFQEIKEAEKNNPQPVNTTKDEKDESDRDDDIR